MIDFSYISDNDGSKPSLIMHDKIVRKLEDAFLHLKDKTGIYVDPYGKTRIYPDHQKILITFLTNTNDTDIKTFIDFLIEAQNADEVIIADGD